jgi:GntR family transcriptional regulator
MKLTRPVPMWQQVADYVRDQILNGTYQAGQPLPSEEALASEFGVSRPTIREGIKVLVAEGLAEVSRPRGTIVRDPFGRPVRTEKHTSATAHDDAAWIDDSEPDYYRVNATADQAVLLGIPTCEPLLTRAITQDSGGIRRRALLYVPFSVAEHTPWADNPRLPSPGQFYDHFTQARHELTWAEHVRARMPIGDEAAALEALPGVPLLIILRIARSNGRNPDGPKPLALEETRQRADQIEVAYTLS